MSYDRLSAALSRSYRIERELGQGGMATVYLAADLKHDRKVAIKVLKPDLAAVLGAERFITEIKTTAALSHPHILPLFDSGEAGGFLYYVMPYLDGETIREKLTREGQFGIAEAVKIATEVAEALDYAHQHGVIHRDIKPENILLHAGRPMVMDFGIALAVSAAAGGRMTETGLSLGTPHYMSPEQATADKQITARSDIYSLASVLYEMLAGEPPHGGGSAQAIIMKIVTDTPRPVTELRKSVPPNVAAALAKALEKVPADRFATAMAFGDALRDTHFTTASAGVAARTTSISIRDWIRHPVSWAALGVVAVVGTNQLRSMNPRVPEQPVVRLETTLPADYYSVDLSRDGRRFMSSAGSDTIYVRDLDDLTPRVIPVRHSVPRLSWEGDRIAFVAFPSRALSVISAHGGSVTTLLDSVGVHVQWGDDDRIYLFRNGRFGRVRATGGPFEPLSTPITGPNAAVHAVLPGGRGAIVSGRGADSTDGFWAVTFDGRTSRLGVEPRFSSGRDHGIRVLPQGYLVFQQVQPQNQEVRRQRVMVAPFNLKTLRVTGEPVVLVDNVALAALSDEGTLIYQLEGPRWRGYFGARGGAVRPAPGLDSAHWTSPVPSPDGRQIAWSRDRSNSFADPTNIWVQDVATGAVRPLTFATGGERAVREPIGWSPDGSLVYFNLGLYSGSGGGLPSYHLMAVRARGAPSTPDTVFSDPTLGRHPSIAPDGRTIVWVGDSAMRRGTLGAAGSQVVLRAPGGIGYNGSRPVSPDGNWLLYASMESGERVLYVQAFGRPDSKFAVATGGGAFWSRSGKSVFVVRDEPAGTWEVPLDLQAGRALAPVKVSDANLWDDVMPGDSVFVGATSQVMAGESVKFVIVQGLLTEIRRRLEGRQ